MRSFFEPSGSPPWLRTILTSIRSALGDPYDHVIRLWKRATADYPTYSQAEHEGAIFYDDTLNRLVYGNSTTFVTLSDYDADIAAIAALSTTGIIVRTGAGTAATRTITGTANEITVANGDGVSGDPTLSLPAALTFTGKTVTGGTFSGPTLSGTVAGTPTTSGAWSISAGATFTNPGGFSFAVSGTKTVSAWTVNGSTYFDVASGTVTDNFSSGGAGLTTRAGSRLGTPTFAATNSITVTNAATFVIAGAVTAGTNVVITNSYAFWVQGGTTRLDGALTVSGNCTLGDNVADAHSITGQVTITESTGAGLILKDSAGNGTAADVHIEFQGADAVVKGSMGPSSAATSNIDVNSASGDVRILTSNTLQATFDGDGLNLVSGNWYEINGVQVLQARDTGWAADTGTAAKGSVATYTSPNISNPPTEAEVQAIADALQAATRSIKALKDLAILHGFAGT